MANLAQEVRKQLRTRGVRAHHLVERALRDEDFGAMLAEIALARTRRRGRDFDKAQRAAMLMFNARYVQQHWRDDFGHKPPHYYCEACEFINPNADLFQIDHVFAKSLGGENQLLPSLAELGSGGNSPDSAEEIDRILRNLVALGSNAMVLCSACNNQGKSDRPHPNTALGYAYGPSDCNPDHF